MNAKAVGVPCQNQGEKHAHTLHSMYQANKPCVQQCQSVHCSVHGSVMCNRRSCASAYKLLSTYGLPKSGAKGDLHLCCLRPIKATSPLPAAGPATRPTTAAALTSITERLVAPPM